MYISTCSVDIMKNHLHPMIGCVLIAVAWAVCFKCRTITNNRFEFALVSDLDRDSRDFQQFVWRSYFKQGTLVRVPPLKRASLTDQFRIEWGNETILESKTSYRNRSMELSELVQYNHLLLTMCDITGLVFKIKPDKNHQPQVFQRWALADGDGEQAKPFKSEWATVKDGLLYIGSIGKEWTVVAENKSHVLHRNSEWIKTIDRNGKIENINLGPVYQAVRTATNTSWPGYLIHEAVHFNKITRRWMFLPRKESKNMYNPTSDEYQGTNLLITTTEDFSDIKVSRIGPLEREYGFTSVRQLEEDLFVALKVREVNGETATKMAVFAINGTMYMDPSFVNVDKYKKFEGLEMI